MKTVAKFSISYNQFINSAGKLVKPLPKRLDDFSLLKKLYEAMVLIRVFDKKAVALQRTGQLGTYPPCVGQEAISVAIGEVMGKQDVLAPYYRDQAAQYLRGIPLHQILQIWGGDERGNNFGGDSKEDLPPCIPIATQVTHAAGIASAFKARKETRAVVTTCGDGGTSRGDFYESLNLAGSWQLPLVIVINNNQWAISVPRDLQTHSETIAQKAIAAGIEGLQVDGNDVCAVYDAVACGLEKAYSGKGPTLIEAISYRLGDHTTADDATRYRNPDELNEAWQKEPIARLRHFLHQHQQWDENQEKTLIAACNKKVEEEAGIYLAAEPQEPTDIIDHLFEDLPESLREQRQRILRKSARLTGGHHHAH